MHDMTLKAWRLGLLLLAIEPLAAGAPYNDIITNGNFTVGRIHWEGDGFVTPAGGTLFIRLKRDEWSILSQKITTPSSRLELDVTYSLSPFCSFLHSRPEDEPVQPLTSVAFKSATGLPNSIRDHPLGSGATWMVFVLDDGKIVREEPVTLPERKENPYTIKVIFDAGAEPFEGESICFAFPPGKGMVTISNVQLHRLR